MSWRRELNSDSHKVTLRNNLDSLDEYQKCESGMRRFGAERLFKFARLMDVPPIIFSIFQMWETCLGMHWSTKGASVLKNRLF